MGKLETITTAVKTINYAHNLLHSHSGDRHQKVDTKGSIATFPFSSCSGCRKRAAQDAFLLIGVRKGIWLVKNIAPKTHFKRVIVKEGMTLTNGRYSSVFTLQA